MPFNKPPFAYPDQALVPKTPTKAFTVSQTARIAAEAAKAHAYYSQLTAIKAELTHHLMNLDTWVTSLERDPETPRPPDLPSPRIRFLAPPPWVRPYPTEQKPALPAAPKTPRPPPAWLPGPDERLPEFVPETISAQALEAMRVDIVHARKNAGASMAWLRLAVPDCLGDLAERVGGYGRSGSSANTKNHAAQLRNLERIVDRLAELGGQHGELMAMMQACRDILKENMEAVELAEVLFKAVNNFEDRQRAFARKIPLSEEIGYDAHHERMRRVREREKDKEKRKDA
jgi:hypothetical protein